MLVVPETVSTGTGSTRMVTVDVDKHPEAPVPVKVYVVLTDGATVTELPLRLPGIQLYVIAPLPVSVALLPAQIVPGVTEDVTVGVVPTVTVIVSVEVHPPVVPLTV